MSIGDLRHPLAIQEAVLTPDGGGGFASTWQDIAEAPQVFAHIEDHGSTDAQENGQLTATATLKITIHYRAGLKAGMRLAGTAQDYDIVSLQDPDGTATWLEIIALVRQV